MSCFTLHKYALKYITVHGKVSYCGTTLRSRHILICLFTCVHIWCVVKEASSHTFMSTGSLGSHTQSGLKCVLKYIRYKRDSKCYFVTLTFPLPVLCECNNTSCILPTSRSSSWWPPSAFHGYHRAFHVSHLLFQMIIAVFAKLRFLSISNKAIEAVLVYLTIPDLLFHIY